MVMPTAARLINNGLSSQSATRPSNRAKSQKNKKFHAEYVAQ